MHKLGSLVVIAMEQLYCVLIKQGGINVQSTQIYKDEEMYDIL